MILSSYIKNVFTYQIFIAQYNRYKYDIRSSILYVIKKIVRWKSQISAAYKTV